MNLDTDRSLRRDFTIDEVGRGSLGDPWFRSLGVPGPRGTPIRVWGRETTWLDTARGRHGGDRSEGHRGPVQGGSIGGEVGPDHPGSDHGGRSVETPRSSRTSMGTEVKKTGDGPWGSWEGGPGRVGHWRRSRDPWGRGSQKGLRTWGSLRCVDPDRGDWDWEVS